MFQLAGAGRPPQGGCDGETGLDYHWHKDAPEWQRERFRTHIRAARATGKPRLIRHTRSAADDTLRLMREEKAGEAGGVMHLLPPRAGDGRRRAALGFISPSPVSSPFAVQRSSRRWQSGCRSSAC